MLKQYVVILIATLCSFFTEAALQAKQQHELRSGSLELFAAPSPYPSRNESTRVVATENANSANETRQRLKALQQGLWAIEAAQTKAANHAEEQLKRLSDAAGRLEGAPPSEKETIQSEVAQMEHLLSEGNDTAGRLMTFNSSIKAADDGPHGLARLQTVPLLVVLPVVGGFATFLTRREWCEQAWAACMNQVYELPRSNSAESSRVYMFDNARFLLQVLVVYGHVTKWQSLHRPNMVEEQVWSLAPMWWARSFHIPMFAFISGMLSKGALTEARVVRIVERILVPLILLFFYYKYTESPSPPGGVVYDPIVCPWDRGSLEGWFLVAYLEWRVVGAVLLSLFSPCAVLIASYFLSWYTGYWHDRWPGWDSPTTQMFALLPFYMTGALLPMASVKLMSVPRVRGMFLGLAAFILSAHICVGLAATSWEDNRIPGEEQIPYSGAAWAEPYRTFNNWGIMKTRFPYFGPSKTAGVMIAQGDGWDYYTAWTKRMAAQFLIIWPAGLSFFALVPQQKTFFSELGQYSIYSYLLHPLLLVRGPFNIPKLLKGPMASHGLIVYHILTLLLALLVTTLLTSNVTRCWAKYLIEPHWLSRFWKEPASAAAVASGEKTAAAAAPAAPASANALQVAKPSSSDNAQKA
mmetsp:Transcript_66019/g.157858  ORF Transcript_66019/g.157858 Transcript_66019/m.157858 type:complete len:637 (-) Transcript_66019:28-1938(-)